MARYTDVTVNSAPESPGSFTNAVGMDGGLRETIFLSIRETGDSSAFSATVTLQFKTSRDDDWQDYDTYTSETYKAIDMVPGIQWRAGVKTGDYTSGELTIGIDW